MSWTLGILVASVLSAQPAAPVRRVAVLDFQASWSNDCVDRGRVSDARREQCEILRLFADRARGGALSVLRPPGFVVMTRENTAQILKDMGGACTEGECEVETARLLGASVVISGEVTLLEGTYLVSLKIHDVASAALLGTGDTRARTKLEAFDNIRAETERMLRESVGLVSAAPPPVFAKPVEPARQPPPPPPKVPAFVVAAAEEPPATPEPEPAAGAPRAHPWYFELGAGVRFFSGPGVNLGGRSASRPGLGQSDAVSTLRVGYDLSSEWALEATGALPYGGPAAESSRVPDPMYMPTFALVGSYEPSFSLALGGAWTPRGNPYFSAALSAGLIAAGVSATGVVYESAMAQRRSDEAFGVSPYVGGELRFDYPLSRSWSIGLRAELDLIRSLTAVEAGSESYVFTSGGGTGLTEVDGGTLAAASTTLALTYRVPSRAGRSAGAAPWYLELDGGVQKLQGFDGKAGKVSGSLEPDSGDTGGTLGLRLGYVLNPEWALEAWSSLLLPTTATFEAPREFGCVNYGACNVTASYREEGSGGVAAAWTPGGNRYGSVAVGAGLVRAAVRTTGYDSAGYTLLAERDEGLSPLLRLELRGDYPITPSLSVGIRVGAQVVFSLVKSSAGSPTSSYGDLEARVDTAKLWSIPASLAVRYRF